MNKKAKEDEETKEQKKQGERDWEPGKMRKGGKRKEEEEQAEEKEKRNRGTALLMSDDIKCQWDLYRKP